MKLTDIFKKKEKRSAVYLTNSELYETLCSSGYTALDKNPEMVAGCMRIADIISSMTIYLMSNTAKGDKRIVNELSRKIDINPTEYMTRRTWMSGIVMNMLLYGSGNAVVYPHTENGLIGDLEPIEAYRVGFRAKEKGYDVVIDGTAYDHSNVLHFVYNPDKYNLWKGQGVTASIKDVADNLKQGEETKRAFMASKWKPSVIVKVDGLTEEFASKAGRSKLLESFVESSEQGEPWLIPSDQFSVEQIRPLSLADLAINDAMVLDKRTVASILGVPPFVVGVGEYNSEEWNGFISNTVRPIVREIEQELTRKLILSPKMYVMFNVASQYSYDLQNVASTYGELFKKGIVTGNEVREKINMAPMDGLDELVILENYIKLDDIEKQGKLNGA